MRRTPPWAQPRRTVVAVVLAIFSYCAWAQTPTSPQSLRQVFDIAWHRQAEAQTLALRQSASRARQHAAQGWTPEPVAVEVSTQTDRLNRNLGAREHAVDLAVPLWLPGQRSRTQAWADAEDRALLSHTSAARLKLAATLREAWWAWQRAQLDAERATAQVQNAQRLAADVARRTRAGDLARADQHQADSAVAAAELMAAQAEAELSAAMQRVRALAGQPVVAASAPEQEPSTAATPHHPEVHALEDRVAVAEQAAALAQSRTRAPPELLIGTRRERDVSGAAYAQSLRVGLRIPFGGGPRHDEQVAVAQADAQEARAHLALTQQRLGTEQDAARARVQAMRAQQAAAERRAQLAREARGFFEKSFRLGETDLPTRLRIEADAVDAERQAARSRIELAAALSALRQALGLLPE